MRNSARQSNEEIRQEKAIRNVVFGMTFLCCFILNMILLIKHQPYRDEVNVWLFAKYASPITLLREIHTQGHPFLWYFLVMPFAKMGFSYRFIEILSFAIMMVTAAIILYQSKLLGIAKIFCLLSPICLYFYPVISRSYCLIALILMLLALCYPQRNKKPVLYGFLIGLVIQADTIALGIAFGLSLAWLLENFCKGFFHSRWADFKKMWKGLWIPAFSVVLWFLQMWKEMLHSDHVVERPEAGEILGQLKGYTFYIVERMTGWRYGFVLLFFVLVFMAALLISVCNMKFGALIVMLCSYGFEVAFSIFCYQLHIWHFIALAFVFVWMVWVMQLDTIKRQEREKREGKTKEWKDKLCVGARIALNVLLAIFAVGMFVHWNSEEENSNLKNAFTGIYSNGPEAADYIEKNLSPDAILISTNISFDNAILAKIDKEYSFHQALTGDIISYTLYTEADSPAFSLAQVTDMVARKWPTATEYYLILSTMDPMEDPENLHDEWMVYDSKIPSVKGEDYRIYCVPLYR